MSEKEYKELLQFCTNIIYIALNIIAAIGTGKKNLGKNGKNQRKRGRTHDEY